MVDIEWIAEIVFFGSYFIAWLSNELAHTTWLNVSAIAAIVIVVLLVVFRGAPYVTRHNTPAA